MVARAWEAPNPAFLPAKLPLVDPVALDGVPIPERRWIVPDWLPFGQVTMLSGDGGTGKTLAAQMLMTACAIGQPWLGLPVASVRTLAIFCEDDAEEIHRRQADINRHYGVSFLDLDQTAWISRTGQDNSLLYAGRFDEPGGPTDFFQAIHSAASDTGAQLIVLDSLHDLFQGNENSRPEARRFIQNLASLAQDVDGGVLLTAHPSLSGRNSGTGESGSTAWNNAVRSRLYLTRPTGDEADETARILQRKKANYAARDAEIRLTWQDGVFVPQVPVGGMVGYIETRAIDRAFLECLDAATIQGRAVTDAKNSARFAPKVFAPMPQAKGVSGRELERAMHRLFNAGEIRMGKSTGSDRHKVKSIVREVREVGELSH